MHYTEVAHVATEVGAVVSGDHSEEMYGFPKIGHDLI
jgi:hypothetical protein